MNILLTAFILSIALSSECARANDVAYTDDRLLIHEANNALAQKDYQTAFTKFAILAQKGNERAQFNLGVFYLNGQGVQKDEKQAFEWFHKSADRGDSRALQFLNNAVKQENVYAKIELTKMKGQTTALQPPVQQLVQPKTRTKPQVHDNVIPASIILKDPTIAGQNSWVEGLSVDFVSNNFSRSTNLGNGSSAILTERYTQPGISAWIGYGDISVLAEYRHINGAYDFGAYGSQYHEMVSKNEFEINVRWLLREYSRGSITPYIIFGYGGNSIAGTTSLLGATGVVTSTTKDKYPLIGMGAIIPVSEIIGFRIDGKFGRLTETYSDNMPSYSNNSSMISRVTANMYLIAASGWSAGLGGQYDHIGLFNGGASSSGASLYATIGYSFR